MRPEAEPPTYFTNLLLVGSMSENNYITNLSRQEPISDIFGESASCQTLLFEITPTTRHRQKHRSFDSFIPENASFLCIPLPCDLLECIFRLLLFKLASDAAPEQFTLPYHFSNGASAMCLYSRGITPHPKPRGNVKTIL